MKEVYGNFWDYPADVFCIPTNGSVRKDGQLAPPRQCPCDHLG